jgi:hypothetical protein
MRFPFVSRTTFEIAMGRSDARESIDRQLIQTLRDLLTKEEQRSSHLMDTVISMKLSGGSVQRLSPLEPGAKLAQTKPPRSRIQQAIDECPAASTNPRTRGYLDSWAAKELERGTMTEEEILEKIRRYSIVSETDEEDETEEGVVPL